MSTSRNQSIEATRVNSIASWLMNVKDLRTIKDSRIKDRRIKYRVIRECIPWYSVSSSRSTNTLINVYTCPLFNIHCTLYCVYYKEDTYLRLWVYYRLTLYSVQCTECHHHIIHIHIYIHSRISIVWHSFLECQVYLITNIHAYTHIHSHAYWHSHTHIHIRTHTHTYTNTRTQTHKRTQTCVYCMRICHHEVYHTLTHTHTHANTHTPTHTHKHTHTNTHTYSYTHIHTYAYTHIHYII